ncbi:MAG: hypothetical protein KDI63_07025 [Gammaproteobacteria bacterium]|nr:hypothetical protein [Gammaproteobacteria bacterium]
MTSIFSSRVAFEEAFKTGLSDLLAGYNELGVFILVLANARFDHQSWERLAHQLEARYRLLSSDLRRHPRWFGLDDAKDDLQVFRRIMEIGLDGISPPECRRVGPWELQFNQLRGFRPPRMTQVETTGIRAPFDQRRFHFNKPFLRKEIMWQGGLFGRNGAIYYNKFPFVPLHALLVPEPKSRHPQYLQAADHDYIWRLVNSLCRTLPCVGFGYNSFGAFASINHLHFQMFQCQRPLPLTDGCWEHNGGNQPYPVRCRRFGSVDESWRYIDSLHRARSSYNLIYLPDTVYCIPRKSQGSYVHSGWTEGFAWHEMGGSFTTSRKADYLMLTADALSAELARVRSSV